MYAHVDGVSMSSPSGAVLANISVGFRYLKATASFMYTYAM